MIISCENCNKKFEVDSKLIPYKGRLLQCSSCDHKWFHKPAEFIESRQFQENNENKQSSFDQNLVEEVTISKKTNNNFGKSLIKIFSYFIVVVISFLAAIILLDTFKSPLSVFFPNLELFLFNLTEILKDIKFFIKDLLS